MQLLPPTHNIVSSFLLLFFLLFNGHGASSCPEKCGDKIIPYPFGLRRSCGLPPFRLHCNSSSEAGSAELKVRIADGRFLNVLSLSSEALIVDPQPVHRCGASNYPIFPFASETSYTIQGSPYALSRANVVMMYDCSSKCECDVRSNFAGAMALERPFNCPNRYCCGLLAFSSLQSLMKNGNCTRFASWFVRLDGNSTASSALPGVQIRYGLELQAWVPGNCSCAANASCESSIYGHTCRCLQGLAGDGFANGLGCYKSQNGTATAALRSSHEPCKSVSLVGCSKNVILLATGIVAGTLIIMAGMAAVVFRRRRGRHRADLQSRKDIKKIKGLLSKHSLAKVFPYKDLERATKGFSEQHLVGNGAFGTVYAGKLQDGTLVAVKRINDRYMQGIEQVANEVNLLTAAKHPNLVRLYGCCLEYGEPLLVYEYVPNGTLADHLHHARPGCHLPWFLRVRIMEETAQALAYLHALDPPIYHRDVKSSNILLDDDFASKVADFGLSRLIPTDTSHISTVPQGTPGYLDPEYHQTFRLSEKSDVYSFGVVLVEAITAMRAVDFARGKAEVNLATLALARIGDGTLDGIIDESLGAAADPQVRASIQTVAEIAYRCLSHDKDGRPTIAEVTQELERVKVETERIETQRP